MPAAIFGLLIASLYGSIYHLARGGGAGRLLLYLALAWVGFIAGHLVGTWFGWRFLMIGPLNTGAATIGSLALLGAGDWLSRIERGE